MTFWLDKLFLNEDTKNAVSIALEAGDLLREGFGTTFSVASKEGLHNLVTDFDHKSEKIILSYLQKKYPSALIQSEECGRLEKENASYRWIIDPLDGTVNFAHGIPVFAVSIALEIDKTITSGVVYQPITKELFVAEIGKGAYLDGAKLSVSKTNHFKKAFLATGFPYNFSDNPNHCLEKFMDILKQGIPIRRIGVAAIDLAYVAAGKFDGFWEASLAPWDCAAGKLIIEEAGGIVTHWDNTPFDIDSYKPIMASNGHIQKHLSDLLTKNYS
jgi:myo-inositol-1(or 4)-monophosphatase